MNVRTTIRVVLWSGLTGGLVAISTILLMDWMMPGAVSIAPASPGQIVVVVDGAVATPGVVHLAAGSRLNAAIDSAGGLAANADTTGLNLAARIGDGEQITIPSRVERATPEDGTVGSRFDPAGILIDINTAAISELDQLPGVGPAIAQRIVDYRTSNGPFDSIEELDEIEGISLEMVEELRPLVTLGE
ncbi:MAG: ComEA family DNA-binding protein [Chloroflexota bacterium]|nr:ComEA family DNA-binding protein [Chloroflexota bacterium]